MLEYIKGEITQISPAHLVIEAGGLGYFVNISLFSYSQFNGQKQAMVYVHENIREDAHVLYGFYEQDERELFRQLINVSGIGANTARMMLSSLSPTELQQAIVGENVNAIKAIKGIGAKTAERVIVDLKDKLGKMAFDQKILFAQDNTIKEEALSALVMLGFNKVAAKKVVDNLLTQEPLLKVEVVIKKALKML